MTVRKDAMKTDRKLRIETLAVHAGHAIDPATGAVAPPIHLSTTFERDAEGGYPARLHLRAERESERDTRSKKGLAALEGGEDAAAFGSGLAASSAVLQALAPGDHVIAPTDVYHGMTKLLREVFMRWGLEVSFVDMTKLDEIKKAVRPKTKLVWVETPSNPRAQNHRHRARSRKSPTRPAPSAPATTPGRRSCSGRSISAPIW